MNFYIWYTELSRNETLSADTTSVATFGKELNLAVPANLPSQEAYDAQWIFYEENPLFAHPGKSNLIATLFGYPTSAVRGRILAIVACNINGLFCWDSLELELEGVYTVLVDLLAKQTNEKLLFIQAAGLINPVVMTKLIEDNLGVLAFKLKKYSDEWNKQQLGENLGISF